MGTGVSARAVRLFSREQKKGPPVRNWEPFWIGLSQAAQLLSGGWRASRNPK